MTRPDEDISEKVICHSCDNPACGNPDHLFSGTQIDNINDRDRKRRAIKKLSDDQVDTIIEKYHTTKTSTIKLGKEFGVSRSMVSAILRGEKRTIRKEI